MHDGWVEQDPQEILEVVRECATKAIGKLESVNDTTKIIRCIGITNQRETIVVWDKFTGEPLYNAIGKIRPLFLIEAKQTAHLIRIK